MVSSTNVDASCTKVRALALEKPEIAEDSESEDRRDWSNEEGTNNRGPFVLAECFIGIFWLFVWWILMYVIDRFIRFWYDFWGFFTCVFFLFYTNNETNNYKRVRKGSGIFFLKKRGEKKKKIKEKEKKQIVTIYLQMMFHIYLIES